MMIPANPALRARLARALVRRFGPSIMPIKIGRNLTRRSWRVVDQETGSWIEAVETGARIRVIAEHDAAAMNADRIDGYDRDNLGESPDF